MHQQLSSSCVWHIVAGALTVGAPWTGPCFPCRCLDKYSKSPCQCYRVFITEGNPAAEPRLPYVLSSYTVGTFVSADLSSTSFTHPNSYSFLLRFPTGLDTCLCGARRATCGAPTPPCAVLIESDSLYREVVGDVLPDITGWQLCHCCYISVRGGRAGALRCSDHVSDAAASKTEPH